MSRKVKREVATKIVRITPSDLKELKKWSKVYGEPITRVLKDAINHYVGKPYRSPRKA